MSGTASIGRLRPAHNPNPSSSAAPNNTSARLRKEDSRRRFIIDRTPAGESARRTVVHPLGLNYSAALQQGAIDRLRAAALASRKYDIRLKPPEQLQAGICRVVVNGQPCPVPA